MLGGGLVGVNAARIAAGFGASVSVLDTSLDRLRVLEDLMPPNVTTLYSYRRTFSRSLRVPTSSSAPCSHVVLGLHGSSGMTSSDR